MRRQSSDRFGFDTFRQVFGQGLGRYFALSKWALVESCEDFPDSMKGTSSGKRSVVITSIWPVNLRSSSARSTGILLAVLT